MKAVQALLAASMLVVGTACVTVIPLGAVEAEADAGDAGAPADAKVEGGPSCRDLPAGTSTRTTKHAGLDRTYTVVRPAGVDPCAPVAALLAFHDEGSMGELDSERSAIVTATAARAGALAISIVGSVGPRGTSGWSCAGCRGLETADDVGLVRAIVAELGIDRRRSALMGVGVGGSFVHRLLADLPFRALGTAPGSTGSPSPPRPVAEVAPVSIVLEHGELDPVFPYVGGIGNRGDSVTSFPDAVTFWKEAGGCKGPPDERVTMRTSSQTFSCNGVEVIAVKWLGEKHAIPDGDPDDPRLSLAAIVERLLTER